MKELCFNRETLKGEFKQITSIVLNVPDFFQLSKEVQEICGKEQKVDEHGNPLFIKEVYREEIIPFVKYYDETVKPNENPIMISKQKTDEKGRNLYLEAIFDEDTKEVVDYLETTRPKDEYGNINEPIIIEVQKTSISGAPLYSIPIMGERVEMILEGVEETTEETDQPVIVDVLIPTIKNIETNPEAFSFEEVILKVLALRLNDSGYDSLFADYFTDTEFIDLEKSIVSTGTQIMQIPVEGCLVTKSLKIDGKAKDFFLLDPLPQGLTMYVNTKKVVDNRVTLASPVSSITIKITNGENTPIDLDHYCLALVKEVEQ